MKEENENLENVEEIKFEEINNEDVLVEGNEISEDEMKKENENLENVEEIKFEEINNEDVLVEGNEIFQDEMKELTEIEQSDISGGGTLIGRGLYRYFINTYGMVPSNAKVRWRSDYEWNITAFGCYIDKDRERVIIRVRPSNVFKHTKYIYADFYSNSDSSYLRTLCIKISDGECNYSWNR